MKGKRFMVAVVILAAMLAVPAVVSAAGDDNPAVNSGETYDGDFIAKGNYVTNDGSVLGDILTLSQRLVVRGTVEGDIIAFATDAYIGGNVGGSLRLAGSSIDVSSRISRNAMMAASSLTLEEGSVIEKNAYLYGDTVKSLGTVEGQTNIYGNDITLGGTYNGDVNIHNISENGTLSMLPGTVINGKLTYRGVTEFHVPSYVTVNEYEYIKTDPVSSEGIQGTDVMGIVKRIATIVVYYLFALLLFRLFPRFFVRSGKFISQNPLQAAGIGIATLGTFVGGLLLLLIIILLVITILEFSVLGFTMLVLFFFAIATLVFAEIPVSLWLGDIILRKTDSVPAKLAAGLAVISAVQLAFRLLRGMTSAGYLFGVLGFLVNAAVWLFGTGSLIKTTFAVLRAANRQAEAEELGITAE